MKRSKLMKQVLSILKKEPQEAFTLYGIAERLGKAEDFNRKSSLRASLSRCLNRMRKEGLVDWEYSVFEHKLGPKQGNQVIQIPKKNEGKFWFIVSE